MCVWWLGLGGIGWVIAGYFCHKNGGAFECGLRPGRARLKNALLVSVGVCVCVHPLKWVFGLFATRMHTQQPSGQRTAQRVFGSRTPRVVTATDARDLRALCS